MRLIFPRYAAVQMKELIQVVIKNLEQEIKNLSKQSFLNGNIIYNRI